MAITKAKQYAIGKNNNICAVQAESSKFASLLFYQGVQIVINSSVVYVPEPIGTPSDSIDPIVVYYVNVK